MRVLGIALIAIGLALLCSGLIFYRTSAKPENKPVSVNKAAKLTPEQVHRSALVIDTHEDTPQRYVDEHFDLSDPLNLGSDELVTINHLVDMVEEIAGIKLKRRYKLDAPKGVRGRNSDNTLIAARLSWAPSTSLAQGLRATYEWIFREMSARHRTAVPR